MFGRPWRKRTGLLGVHICLEPAVRLCKGRGQCTRTGRPHQHLCGANKDGVFWTSIAEPYPPQLCKQLVQCFSDAAACLDISAWESTWLRPQGT
eukprot:2412014-Lingulodinium_polyedra.AAC.1